MMKPLIAIPMGDAAGVGPEIILKTLADKETQDSARCLVIGSRKLLEHAMRYPNLPHMEIHTVSDPAQGDYRPDVLNLIDLDNIDMEQFQVG